MQLLVNHVISVAAYHHLGGATYRHLVAHVVRGFIKYHTIPEKCSQYLHNMVDTQYQPIL